MLDVIEAAFPEWPPFEFDLPKSEHLQWKLGPTGDSTPRNHIVVELDGRIVGTRLCWSAPVQVGAADYAWEHSAELAVHPDFQGRGISRLISELRSRGFEESGHLRFSTPSRNPQIQRMDGPRHNRRPLTVWTRQRSPRTFIAAHYRSGGPRQLARAVAAVARQRRIRGRAELELRRGGVEALDRFDETTDALWQSARRSFEVVTHREAAYQNWRHLDQRGGATLTLALREDTRCLGYVVFKPDGDTVNVVDLLIEPGRTAVLATLLTEGIARLGTARSFAIWLPTDSAYEPGLRGAGFIPTATHEYTFANQLYDDGPPEAQRLLRDDSTRFHITMSDFDYF